MARGVDFPQLLDADGVALRVAFGVELVAGDELLAQLAARAFGKQRVFAQQLHAQLEVFGRLAVFAHAHVARGHALDAAFFVIQHFGGGKAGEDFHAKLFGLRGQPARDVAQADDVAAVAVGKRRQQYAGHPRAAAVAVQKDIGFVRDGLVQRRAFFLPVGNQLVQRSRIHDGA